MTEDEEMALEAAKKELGDSVVVMNAKKVKPKGLFAFFKPQQTEVTVALEEESERFARLEAKEEKPPKTPLPELKPLKPMGEAGGDDIQGAISDIARLQEKYERLESLRNSSNVPTFSFSDAMPIWHS